MSTRLEINFNRLLSQCENIASDKDSWTWRFQKYVEALQNKLGEIKRSTSKPSQDILIEYTRRVDFLKGILEAEQKTTACEKILAAERLAPVTHTQKSAGVAPKEVHLQTKSRLQKDVRAELLGEDTSKIQNGTDSNDLRHRKPAEDTDIDAVLKHHRKMHEKLAEDLLHHTHNLKHFAYASRDIVKKDIEKVTETNKLADSNYGNLQVQSQRLEAKTKTCNWWIWIMLFMVTVTFLCMIVFMRIFPKS